MTSSPAVQNRSAGDDVWACTHVGTIADPNPDDTPDINTAFEQTFGLDSSTG
jgi:hypothetical protein